MTIADLDKGIQQIISEHHVYGAEVILMRLVVACKNEKYLQEDNLIELLRRAEQRLREEQ